MTQALPEQLASRGIVVGYDGRPAADGALGWAAREAFEMGHQLTLVEVITSTPVLRVPGLVGLASLTVPPAPDIVTRTALDTATTRVVDRFPGMTVEHLGVRGDPVAELLSVSRDAALLVVGSRGVGAARTIPSAQVGTRLARRATGPVVVVPHFREGLVRRGVLAGVSLRKHAPEVLEHAYAYADAHELPLTIVHANRDTLRATPDERARWLAETISGYATRYPSVRVDTRVETGRPSRILLHLAEQMDLLVVGQHTAGEANPLGHVRSSIADRSPCPTLVVPPAPPSQRRPS